MDNHAFKDVEINSLKVVGKKCSLATVGKNEKRSLVPKPGALPRLSACNIEKLGIYRVWGRGYGKRAAGKGGNGFSNNAIIF